MQNKDNETIFQEEDMGRDSYAWVRSRCAEAWIFEVGTPKENEYRYCPGCGRKIVEFRQYVDDDEPEEDV